MEISWNGGTPKIIQIRPVEYWNIWNNHGEYWWIGIPHGFNPLVMLVSISWPRDPHIWPPLAATDLPISRSISMFLRAYVPQMCHQTWLKNPVQIGFGWEKDFSSKPCFMKREGYAHLMASSINPMDMPNGRHLENRSSLGLRRQTSVSLSKFWNPEEPGSLGIGVILSNEGLIYG